MAGRHFTGRLTAATVTCCKCVWGVVWSVCGRGLVFVGEAIMMIDICVEWLDGTSLGG